MPYVQRQATNLNMRASPQAGQFPEALTLRLTSEQRKGLEKAVHCTPGCASPSGVARLAIDNYLAEVLSKSTA
jgi:hypothetical protein